MTQITPDLAARLLLMNTQEDKTVEWIPTMNLRIMQCRTDMRAFDGPSNIKLQQQWLSSSGET